MARAALIFKDRFEAFCDLTKIGLSLMICFFPNSVCASPPTPPTPPPHSFASKEKQNKTKYKGGLLWESLLVRWRVWSFHDWLALPFISPPFSCSIELKNLSIPDSNLWYRSCYFGGLAQDSINLEGRCWKMDCNTELKKIFSSLLSMWEGSLSCH